MDGQVGRCQGTGLWREFSPAQEAASVAEAQRNPLASARSLKLLSTFLGGNFWLFSRLQETDLSAWDAAVKGVLNDEHKPST